MNTRYVTLRVRFHDGREGEVKISADDYPDAESKVRENMSHEVDAVIGRVSRPIPRGSL